MSQCSLGVLTYCPDTWKHLRNVEHILRDRADRSAAPKGKNIAPNTRASSEDSTAQCAPDLDLMLLDTSAVIPPPPAPPSSPPRSSHSCIGPDLGSSHLVGATLGNHAGFDAPLAAVWAALGRQQAAHYAFRDETRRELEDLRGALSVGALDTQNIARERDALRIETAEKTEEIERLRLQLRALESRLASDESTRVLSRGLEGPTASPSDDVQPQTSGSTVTAGLSPLARLPLADGPPRIREAMDASEATVPTASTPPHLSSPPTAQSHSAVPTESVVPLSQPSEGMQATRRESLPEVDSFTRADQQPATGGSTGEASPSRASSSEPRGCASPKVQEVDDVEEPAGVRSDGLAELSAYASSSEDSLIDGGEGAAEHPGGGDGFFAKVAEESGEGHASLGADVEEGELCEA